MKKLLVFGVIVLIFGLAIAPSINANINRQSLEPTPEIIVEDYDGYTPIQLVFQLIAKLSRNREIHKLVEETDNEVDIQNGIISIIETDWELNTIIENIKGSDCGCDDANTTEWGFPVICFILPFLLFFPMGLLVFFILTGGGYIVDFLYILLGVLAIIITVLDIIFNCGYS